MTIVVDVDSAQRAAGHQADEQADQRAAGHRSHRRRRAVIRELVLLRIRTAQEAAPPCSRKPKSSARAWSIPSSKASPSKSPAIPKSSSEFVDVMRSYGEDRRNALGRRSPSLSIPEKLQAAAAGSHRGQGMQCPSETNFGARMPKRYYEKDGNLDYLERPHGRHHRLRQPGPRPRPEPARFRRRCRRRPPRRQQSRGQGRSRRPQGHDPGRRRQGRATSS